MGSPRLGAWGEGLCLATAPRASCTVSLGTSRTHHACISTLTVMPSPATCTCWTPPGTTAPAASWPPPHRALVCRQAVLPLRRTSPRTLHCPWSWTPPLSPGRGTRTQMYPHCGGRGQKERGASLRRTFQAHGEPWPLSTWGPGPRGLQAKRACPPSCLGWQHSHPAHPRKGLLLVLLGPPAGRHQAGTLQLGTVAVGHHSDCPIKPPLCRPDLPFCLSHACPLPCVGLGFVEALPGSPQQQAPLALCQASWAWAQPPQDLQSSRLSHPHSGLSPRVWPWWQVCSTVECKRRC